MSEAIPISEKPHRQGAVTLGTPDDDARHATSRRISRMRERLAGIRDTLSLVRKLHRTARAIASRAVAFWKNLVELEGGYREAYGEPVPEPDACLNPQVWQPTRDLQVDCLDRQ